jgi:hypothetical protein
VRDPMDNSCSIWMMNRKCLGARHKTYYTNLLILFILWEVVIGGSVSIFNISSYVALISYVIIVVNH